MTTLAFWHPFGPHGGQSPEKIIESKLESIKKNKWTLWSFQHRTREYMETWIQEISKSKQKRVFVLCSTNKNNSDTSAGGKKIRAKQYCEYHKKKWDAKDIPKDITVYHPWNVAGLASAFVVSKIYLSPSQPKILNQCNCFDFLWNLNCDFRVWSPGKWIKSTDGCTRGEKLIKLDERKKIKVIRPICVILELKKPYVVEIRRDCE